MIHKFHDIDAALVDVYSSITQALDNFKARENIRKNIIFDTFPIPKDSIPFVLFRQLGSPYHEICRFINIVDAYGGTPIIIEYLQDKFASINPLKKSLGKMVFIEGSGKKGGIIKSSKTIIDFNTSDGKKINEVVTNGNESLVDFHHELLRDFFSKKIEIHTHDASEWFIKHGTRAKDYYVDYLEYFVADAILFENFVMSDPDESKFTHEVVLPALRIIKEKTGLKPSIVPILSPKEEGDSFWSSYPDQVRELVHKKLSCFE